LSPARRVRRSFMVVGLLSSIGFFFWWGADVLFAQWAEGRASAAYIFGTACLIAGASMMLFAVIVAIGLVVSSAFSDEPPPR
jgi:hypothetical protein